MAPLALQEAHKSLKTAFTRAHGPACPYYHRPLHVPSPAALVLGLSALVAPHVPFRAGSSSVNRLLVELRRNAPAAQARAQARTFAASARAPARVVGDPRGFEAGLTGALSGAEETNGVGQAFRFFAGETGRGILRHAKARVESAERLAAEEKVRSRQSSTQRHRWTFR